MAVLLQMKWVKEGGPRMHRWQRASSAPDVAHIPPLAGHLCQLLRRLRLCKQASVGRTSDACEWARDKEQGQGGQASSGPDPLCCTFASSSQQLQLPAAQGGRTHRRGRPAAAGCSAGRREHPLPSPRHRRTGTPGRPACKGRNSNGTTRGRGGASGWACWCLCFPEQNNRNNRSHPRPC
jgi:hypothetical protein